MYVCVSPLIVQDQANTKNIELCVHIKVWSPRHIKGLVNNDSQWSLKQTVFLVSMVADGQTLRKFLMQAVSGDVCNCVYLCVCVCVCVLVFVCYWHHIQCCCVIKHRSATIKVLKRCAALAWLGTVLAAAVMQRGAGSAVNIFEVHLSSCLSLVSTHNKAGYSPYPCT